MPKTTMLKRLLSAYSLAFFVFLYAPVVLIVVYSFNANPINIMNWTEASLDWYRIMFGYQASQPMPETYIDSTGSLLSALKNSLVVALFATLISTLLGTMVALALARFRFKLQPLYRMFMHIPMVMPDIVLGIALLIFFISSGLTLGSSTIVIGHCTFLISYVFIVVSARLADMDPQLERASADLGANEWQTFRRVTLPLILPGVVGGALLSFVISMDDVVITYFISGTDSTTLPVYILSMIRKGIKPEINAIATLMLIFSLLFAYAGIYFKSKKTSI
ncbi:spermidine/putrescine transport system permease protein [Vibrio xiamenensis]|uniref:Spermidine/putrescine transport system permease protein n=1 Tax=Vibrio xiamenensis TaxID=861298 RepID=A0A1G8GVP1_9VIBR|nr:ABC transporter permease [Vibrio xiamenensis]SDH98290.1 spermidine/putrescine transport system permease protein [Vibrio xiamenensis]